MVNKASKTKNAEEPVVGVFYKIIIKRNLCGCKCGSRESASSDLIMGLCSSSAAEEASEEVPGFADTSDVMKEEASRPPLPKVLPREGLPRHIQTSVDALSNLSANEVRRVCAAMEREVFVPGATILTQGDTTDKLYILARGRVNLAITQPPSGTTSNEGSFVAELEVPMHFGESALLAPGGRGKARNSSVLVPDTKMKRTKGEGDDAKAGVVECFTISAGAFAECLEPPSTIDHFIARVDPPDQNVTRHAQEIPKSELRQVALLGTGTSGRVFLVARGGRREDDNVQYFAMKVLLKSDVEESKQSRMIERERRLLKSVDHPFVVKFYGEYESPSEVALLQEFCQGGELFALLHPQTGEEHGIPSSEARFHAAVIQRAVSHIHSRGIIYRDLKPENVLIDSNGYCKVIDFGLSKKLGATELTTTLCGTVEYVAPEMINGHGYTRAVDWWAFGILLYEMVAGRTPFFANNDHQVCQNIMAGKIRFLRKFDPEDKAFLKKLLVADPSRRLTDADKIRSDECLQFDGVEELESYGAEAPWIPDIIDGEDTSCFQATSPKQDQLMPPVLSPTRT